MENYHIFDKINNKKSLKIRDFVDFIGAREGNRTLKVLLPADFESAASTNSATLALLIKYIIIEKK